ncbi:hypothetical protein K7X08_019582 [Anisodus acutangulus]|uniref:RNase H type-1 domain-containing protein n=1 Tax=Anisodus acutangulus TaxID=402998 RepID=A0A9Q1RQ58_9SOLA|nr:hypothetical protein K7X08_019582 [Anisodus acutangulus]
MAEARALLTDLNLCLRMGLYKVIVESDSQLIINMITHKMKAPWQLSYIIDQITRLSSNAEFVFVHIYREGGNMVADNLANIGEHLKNPIDYDQIESLPASVKSLIRMDLQGTTNFKIKSSKNHYFNDANS